MGILGRIHELRFEIVKTRATLFHSIDETLGAAAVAPLIEASERTARQYIAGVTEPTERPS